MYHSQLIERTNNEPVNAEHLHGWDVHTVLSFSDKLVREVVNWRCHTILHGPFSDPCLLLRSEAFICSALGCQVSRCLPPSGLSNLFQASVAMSLSKSTWARTCWTGSIDRRRDDTLSTHAPAACYIPHPFHVCHAPKKFAEKTFVALHKSAKFISFLPQKFPTIR